MKIYIEIVLSVYGEECTEGEEERKKKRRRIEFIWYINEHCHPQTSSGKVQVFKFVRLGLHG